MTQQILALDPAASTGFAHSDGWRGAVLLTSPFDHRPGDRLNRFERWLIDALTAHKTELIAAEDASFGSHNPSVQAGHNELKAIIHLVAASWQIDVKFFKPNTIKLFATGHGNAKKPDMIRACREKLGIVSDSDDEVDAIWILGLAQRPDCWPKPKPSKAAVRKFFKKQPKLF